MIAFEPELRSILLVNRHKVLRAVELDAVHDLLSNVEVHE